MEDLKKTPENLLKNFHNWKIPLENPRIKVNYCNFPQICKIKAQISKILTPNETRVNGGPETTFSARLWVVCWAAGTKAFTICLANIFSTGS